MVLRKIIKINEELCDGCGLCADSCHEGAIRIVDGKARLVSESYCDGLGDCLSECPRGAITIEERETAKYDEAAVQVHLARRALRAQSVAMPGHPMGGCPGKALRTFQTQAPTGPKSRPAASISRPSSSLGHWPVQLKLVPPHAPFLKNADLLVCADCVPFAVPDFHEQYLSGKAVLVGCPKLDNLPFYLDKLRELFAAAAPRSITVLKMEVPCCEGLARVAVQARNETAPGTETLVCTIGLRGEELDRQRFPAGVHAA